MGLFDWLRRKPKSSGILVGGMNYDDLSCEAYTPERAAYNDNVYACVAVLSGDIAKLPLHVHRRKGHNVEIDRDHAVSKLLGDQPNPYMTPYKLKELAMAHCMTWGNAYINIEWGEDGHPCGLWPLNPAVTEPYADANTGDVGFVTTLPNGEQCRLPHEDVIHLAPWGMDGLKGLCPLRAVEDTITAATAANRFSRAFWRRGTLSQGVLKAQSNLNDTAKQAMRDAWERANTGINNAGRVMILDAGVEYASIGVDPKSAQFTETLQQSLLNVAKIYKIPPYKLGVGGAGAMSSLEQIGLEYVKNTLAPIIAQWEQEINRNLFTARERRAYYTKFNLTAELRGDAKSRAEFYTQMIGTGAMTINEARALEDLPSIGELGDAHYMSLNYTQLENLLDYQRAKAGLTEKEEPDAEPEAKR